MKNKEFILFDLDGTITDSSDGIINSVKYALFKFGIEETDYKILYKFIGPPLLDAFMEYYGFEKEKALKAVECYREYYSVKGIFENRLYDGIKELLIELYRNGKKVILATSKPEKYAKIILSHFEIDEYFNFVGAATMDEKRSEKEDIIKYILEEYKINPQKAVMIGDRKFDIFGGREFGIDTIGVLYGFGSREELEKAKADIIAESTKKLKEILI